MVVVSDLGKCKRHVPYWFIFEKVMCCALLRLYSLMSLLTSVLY